MAPEITFERSADYRLIRSVLTHPRIYPHITDDNSPPVDQYRPIEHDSIWYVLARGDGDLLGLWMFVPQNSVCWEVHTALMPCGWGDVGLEAARQLPDWIWAHTSCRRIITNVPVSNRLAFHFAVHAGMRIFGVNESSYLKKGRLWDQVCLGLSPREETARREAETGIPTVEFIGGG